MFPSMTSFYLFLDFRMNLHSQSFDLLLVGQFLLFLLSISVWQYYDRAISHKCCYLSLDA